MNPPRLETGADWLDLLATVSGAYGPTPTDRLTGPERLAEWWAVRRLAPVTGPEPADVERARALREALRRITWAVLDGQAWPEPDLRLVNETLAAERPLTVHPGDGPAPGTRPAPPETSTEALARLTRRAVEQLTGSDSAALHHCADPICAMLFLDPGGRRRWCSAEICGVRHRVRAHRRRRREPERPGSPVPPH